MSQQHTFLIVLSMTWILSLGCDQAPDAASEKVTAAEDEKAPDTTTELDAIEAASSKSAAKSEEADVAITATPSFYTVDHYGATRDPAKDLVETLARANAENKRVLLQVGGDWCGWCKLMTNFIESNVAVREMIDKHFLLMKVTWMPDQKNEEFLSQYPAINGYPHLFVLDKDGSLLHSQDTAELEEGKGYNEEVYLKFLTTWADNP